MRYGAFLMANALIFGLVACQPREIKVEMSDELSDFLADSDVDAPRQINPLAQKISDNYTMVQMEDCAHISNVSQKAVMVEGGNPAAGSAHRALVLIFEGASELESGEVRAYEDMAEASSVFDTFNEQVLLSNRGSVDLQEKMNVCATMLNIIYSASFSDLMIGAYK